MSLAENSYGRAKRLAFMEKTLKQVGARRVLDVGCGSGSELTVPLAKRLPDATFLAIDDDADSIAHAQGQPHPPNVTFHCTGLPEDERFDAVILSEVAEHVEDPGGFLRTLAANVAEDGHLILTTPNGYGPFEWSQTIESLLWWCGLYDLLRRVKRWLTGTATGPAASDTLAVSPHLNFFTRRDVERLLREAGLAPIDFRARTFVCGFGFDQLFTGPRFYAWNARVSDWLPSCMASAWMFVARRTGPPVDAPRGYRRHAWARFRRWLNERRWGLA